MEPNCDFHIVCSTLGSTGNVTPKRSSLLVNSTYSWATTDPAMARTRAADTALRRMVFPLTCDGVSGLTDSRRLRRLQLMAIPYSLPLFLVPLTGWVLPTASRL